MTLYLKYRPKNLEELDLKSVRESLERIVKSSSLPHAFLFAGPKGTGKTSAARIIAKMVNCVKNEKKLNAPCNKCEQCTTIANSSNIDVIELDAASHRGIDDIRVLRDAVKLAPAKARKKVYIIDEAHMLTTEASNALLKILEEPPSHVMFILATTNPEKLISTIRSRTTIIHFNKATNEEVIRSLKRITKGEKKKMDDKILDLIAHSSDGSFRDAAKILEQLFAEKIKLKYDSVNEFLNKKIDRNIDDLIVYLNKRDETKAIELLDNASKKGISANDYIDGVIVILRNALLSKVGLGNDDLDNWSKDDLVYLIELLIEAKGKITYATIEFLPLELAIVKWCSKSKTETNNGENDKNKRQDKNGERNNLNGKSKKKEAEDKNSKTKSKPNGSISDIQWRRILDEIKPINTSIEALLRAAEPLDFDGKILKLGVFYKFHKERLEDRRNKQVLESVVEKVLSFPARVVCTLTRPPEKKQVVDKVELREGEDEDIIKVAKDIFGN